jgi:hypothetical protein
MRGMNKADIVAQPLYLWETGDGVCQYEVMYNGRSSPEDSVDLEGYGYEVFYSGKIGGMNEDLLGQFWGQLSKGVHGGGNT